MRRSESWLPGRAARVLRENSILLIAVPALLLSQWILDVAGWFGFSMRRTPVVGWLDSLPGFASRSSFPPGTRFGLLALALAAAGFWLWFRKEPGEIVLHNPAPFAPPQGRPTARGRRVLVLVVALVLSALVSAVVLIRRGAAGVDPPLSVWALAAISLLALGRLADRRAGCRIAWGKVPLDLAYCGGTVALLAATAYLLRGGQAPAAACFALAVGLLEPVFRRKWNAWQPSQRAERLALPALMVGSFLLCSQGLDSWARAMPGDAYVFFDTASRLAGGALKLTLGTGAHGYHPLLSSLPAAVSMRAFGADGPGWLLANPLLLALALPFFHYTFRSFLGVGVALAADVLLCTSHYLQTFLKIGYNNPLALTSLGISLACLTWALRSGMWVAFAATGVALGLGFFTFGVAWLFPLLLTVWLAVYVRPTTARNVAAWLVVAVTTAVTALPVLLNRDILAEYFANTPLGAGGAAALHPLGAFATRCLYGLVLFATNGQHTHGITTAHTDPLTGAGIVVGAAALLAGRTSDHLARRAWLGLAVVAVLTIAGFEQYDYPATTRMFILVPVYAFLAAVGFASLSRRLFPGSPEGRAPGWGLTVVVLVAASAVLNTLISTVISPRRVARDVANYLVLFAQRSAAPPATLLVAGPLDEPALEQIFAPADVPASRWRSLGQSASFQWMYLQHFRDRPAICLVPFDGGDGGSVRALAAAAWPGSREYRVGDFDGAPKLFAVLNVGALATLRSAPSYFHEEQSRERPAPAVPPGEDARVGWFEVTSSFQRFGRLQQNCSFDGSPLSVGGRLHTTGLGTHAPSRVRLGLESGYRTFVGACGIDDEVGRNGSVKFRIACGGRNLFSSPLMRGGDAAAAFSIDTSECRELSLIVDEADGVTDFDHADWVDLRLLP